MQGILSRVFPSTSSTLSAAVPVYVDRRPPPPTDLGKWANFRRLKLTPTSFLVKILSFYLVFIMIMFGLFATLVLGYTNYIRDNYKDPWISKNEIIGKTPGIAFFPNIHKFNSPLIWYTSNGSISLNMNSAPYVEYIKQFLAPYEFAARHTNIFSDCDKKKMLGRPCMFLRKQMGLCGADPFGYNENKPCFYIKINRVPGWTPTYFDGHDLPGTMPESLKEVIRADHTKEKIYVHCEGVLPSDKEHVGKFTYYPQQGFNGYFFPYSRNDYYLTPLVAVKMDYIKEGYIVNIECSIWAKNILHEDTNQNKLYIQIYIAGN